MKHRQLKGQNDAKDAVNFLTFNEQYRHTKIDTNKYALNFNTLP